ncbi:MAG: hypothetical protein JXR63_03945 [Spirochaetales bacterium]|nr:hypothetical protein [Spirochaetales bacterium]
MKRKIILILLLSCIFSLNANIKEHEVQDKLYSFNGTLKIVSSEFMGFGGESTSYYSNGQLLSQFYYKGLYDPENNSGALIYSGKSNKVYEIDNWCYIYRDYLITKTRIQEEDLYFFKLLKEIDGELKVVDHLYTKNFNLLMSDSFINVYSNEGLYVFYSIEADKFKKLHKLYLGIENYRWDGFFSKNGKYVFYDTEGIYINLITGQKFSLPLPSGKYSATLCCLRETKALFNSTNFNSFFTFNIETGLTYDIESPDVELIRFYEDNNPFFYSVAGESISLYKFNFESSKFDLIVTFKSHFNEEEVDRISLREVQEHNGKIYISTFGEGYIYDIKQKKLTDKFVSNLKYGLNVNYIKFRIVGDDILVFSDGKMLE